ncbi:MAG: hypothetical protein Q9196_004565 [Gyalolechia fulgens]
MIHVGIFPAGMTHDLLSSAISMEAKKFEEYFVRIKLGTVYLSDGSSVREKWTKKIKDQDPLDEKMYHELINDIMNGLHYNISTREFDKRKHGKKSFEFDEDEIRKYAEFKPAEDILIAGALRPEESHWICKENGHQTIDRIYDGFYQPNPPDTFDRRCITAESALQGARYGIIAKSTDGWPGYEHPSSVPSSPSPSATHDDDSGFIRPSTSSALAHPQTPADDELMDEQSEIIRLREEYIDKRLTESLSDDESMTDYEERMRAEAKKERKPNNDPLAPRVDEKCKVSKRKSNPKH